MPIELKPCKKCGKKPVPFGIEFDLLDGDPEIRFQYRCIQCRIGGNVCRDLAGAAEAWNRRTDDAGNVR